VRRQPGEVVLVVGGDLDLATAPLLATTLADVLGGESGPRVVLDLADLDFIDAVGLGHIIGARRRLSDRGGTLVVRQPSPPARRLLELCELGDLVR